MMIRCDHVNPDFTVCPNELAGLGFDAVPDGWQVVVFNEYGDHRDYCPEHQRVTFS